MLETVLGEGKTKKDKEANKAWLLTSRSSRFDGRVAPKQITVTINELYQEGHSKIFWWHRAPA